MYEGIPELSQFMIDMAKRLPYRSRLAISEYHMLGDFIKALEHANNHYLALTLNESYLQNSHLGTPYQKWAIITSDDFGKVDKILRYLGTIGWEIYSSLLIAGDKENNSKEAFAWFAALKNFRFCVINTDEPYLEYSTINFDDWVDPDGWILPIKAFNGPPVFNKHTIYIEDRAILMDIKQNGIVQIDRMRGALTEFAKWLEENYTMQDVVNLQK